MHLPVPSTYSFSQHSFIAAVLGFLLLAGCDSYVTDPAESGTDFVRLEGDEAAFKITDTIGNCTVGTQSSGALFEVCLPPGGSFNGTLLVYAHGFVFPQAPLALPDDELDGAPAKQIILSQGFAYAATSYYTNGLVDPQKGLKDLRELIVIFNNIYGRAAGRAENVVLIGFSNGAFLSTVALEKQAGLFDGALASCGPIGEYHRQIEYYGDVLLLFQYFFPGVIPGGPDGMPESFLALGEAAIVNLVLTALASDPASAQQLFTILAGTSAIVGEDPLTGALPPLDQATLEQLALALTSVLQYAVFPVNDAIDKLGGSPYGNVDRVYGDLLDPSLAPLVAAVNAGVARYEADRGALAQLEARFKSHGNLKAPLVALHNRYDPIVPFWQATLYQEKLSGAAAGLFLLNPVPVSSQVGHCDFTANELFGALAVLQQAMEGVVL